MQQPVGRIHYMDAMRTVLMMLGIFNHSAVIYNPYKEWKINSVQSLEIITWLYNSSLAFRMSGFFVISGFFCALTLSRYDPVKFLKVRLTRIALPLVVTACTLNLLQQYLLGRWGLLEYSLTGYFLDGDWVSHLWFLKNLLVYFLVAALFVMAFKRFLTPLNDFLAVLTAKVNFYFILALLPLAFIGFLALNVLGYPLYGNFWAKTVQVFSLTYYIPFFLVGILFYTIPSLLERFCTMNIWVIIGVLIAAFVLLQPNLPRESVPQVAGYYYFYALVQWCSICLLFKFFRTFFNEGSKLWKFGADAAYSVYLFHHILVVILGYFAVSYGLHPLIAMPLIISMTLTITLLNHVYVIKRIPLLQLLYNGK